MLRRGNRDNLISDRERYDHILEEYEKIHREEDKISFFEWAIIFFICATITTLLAGAIISILNSLFGVRQ